MERINHSILLCDMGGTHARFAKHIAYGSYINFKKYRLNDFSSFEDIVQTYLNETSEKFLSARFAVARTPIDGVISYKRFAGDPDYKIDFNVIQGQFCFENLILLNDLEAGAHGANILTDTQYETIIPSVGDTINKHKVLISVGTGIGHAGIMNDEILRTAGGHFFPVTVTPDHRAFELFVREQKDKSFALIMEDFVSARGLRMIAEFVSGEKNDALSNVEFMEFLKTQPKAISLFFEFLGLYAQNLVSVMGFYGGVFITGGVIDYLIKNDLADWDSFEKYFRPAMVEVVKQRLNGCPVNYVLHDELPLLGLTTL